MYSYCLCTQPATATLTQGAVVSTPSCFCCLDDAAAECVYAVDITPPVDCVSTAEKATTATAVDPSTTAGLVDVSPRPYFNFWVLSQCGFWPGLLTSASLPPLNILSARNRQRTVFYILRQQIFVFFIFLCVLLCTLERFHHKLEIRSVERGICPIATSTINKRTIPIIMAGCMAHEREGYIFTSGLKSDVTLVFLDPDFL